MKQPQLLLRHKTSGHNITKRVVCCNGEAKASRVGMATNTMVPGPRPRAQSREVCSYSEFLKCKPWTQSTEGSVVDSLDMDALTCEMPHVKTTLLKHSIAKPWQPLKKMMTDKYCPRGEIKKIETEMWNLKVKGTDVVAYSRRFQQLALMCSRMFPEEVDKIEKYIGGLPDMILGSVHPIKIKDHSRIMSLHGVDGRKRPQCLMLNVTQKERKNDDTRTI
ncbi:reverse transcriptase domain-containing protein [Tanacetum coccineum]